MKRVSFLTIFGIVIMGITSCGSSDNNIASKTNAKNLSHLSVEKVVNEDVTIYKEYATNIEGEQNVEIRSRVSGFIEKIYIYEGASVRKGQLLFKINAETLRQQVKAASANVDVAISQVELAQVECEKIKPLVAKNIISPIELKTSNSRLNAAKSQLNAAKANYLNVKENMSFALITSPVDGIVGSIPYKVGSLVGRNEPDALTVVSNVNNVYAYFSMNEKQLLTFLRSLDGDSMDEKIKQMPELELYLADGSLYEEKGKIETINGMINPRTGSVSYRVKFPNTNKLLRNGNSGRLRFPNKFNNVIVLAQNYSFKMQGKRFVYIMNEDNIVSSKEVIVSAVLGDKLIINKGLIAGEVIVTEGIARLKNGMEILPKFASVSEAGQVGNVLSNK